MCCDLTGSGVNPSAGTMASQHSTMPRAHLQYHPVQQHYVGMTAGPAARQLLGAPMWGHAHPAEVHQLGATPWFRMGLASRACPAAWIWQCGRCNLIPAIVVLIISHTLQLAEHFSRRSRLENLTQAHILDSCHQHLCSCSCILVHVLCTSRHPVMNSARLPSVLAAHRSGRPLHA